MNYWTILGIEETTDTRAIKRAYAAKLKKTRPDEDPEGFKALHAAYKWAVDFSKNNIEYVETVQTEEPETTTPEPAEIPQHHADEDIVEENSEEDEYFAYLQEQWQILTDQVDKITESIDSINNIEAWRFLEGNEVLLDLHFKSQFSYYVFASLVECLEKYTDEKRVSTAVCNYLDQIFFWSDQRSQLEDEYGIEAVEKIFHAADADEEQPLKWNVANEHQGKIEYAGYYARLFATLLDWLLFTFLLLFLEKINIDPFDIGNEKSIMVIFYAIFLFIVVSSVLEATPLQGSFGKILFGMKVASSKGKRLNIFHSLFRGVVYFLNLIGFKITVWINFFLNDGRLLHDRVSGTIVIKR